MQLIRVEVEFSQSAGPEYGAPKARAVIAYGLTVDENITAEAALNAAMTVAVAHVRKTLGLYPKPAEPATVEDPSLVAPVAEKPKRGRPAGYKNNPNPEVKAKADTEGTVAGGGTSVSQAATTPASAEKNPATQPVASEGADYVKYTADDVNKVCRRIAATDGHSDAMKTRIKALIATFVPAGLVPSLSTVPENRREELVDALEAIVKAKA